MAGPKIDIRADVFRIRITSPGGLGFLLDKDILHDDRPARLGPYRAQRDQSHTFIGGETHRRIDRANAAGFQLRHDGSTNFVDLMARSMEFKIRQRPRAPRTGSRAMRRTRLSKHFVHG